MSTTTVTWKILCHWLLAPPMSLQCGLKHSPWSTEWIDVYYKYTCGNIIILWNLSFRTISMRITESMPIGNGQLSKTGYESCLLYYMVTSIEQKVFTLKHGLNIGRSIYQYRLLITRDINNSSPSKMNKRKFVLQALLTRIRLTMKCVICRLMNIMSV